VEKEKIVDLIRNPQNLGREDIYTLEKWVIQYPYFQLGHILIAKIANDNKIPNKEVKLNYAAIYSPNRGVLKRIILSSLSDIPQFTANSNLPKQSGSNAINNPQFSEPVSEELKIKNDHYNQKLREEYLLKREKHEAKSKTEVREDEIPAPKVNQDLVNEVLANLEKAKKLKKEFLDREKIDEAYTSSTPSNDQQSSDIETSEEETIEDDDNVSASKQRDLIDTFIENEKDLGKIKPRQSNENHEDLSERSTSLSDDMVSENLASILQKQGKKEKAIDIYKKLIWKFPQKRTYFATLIEELKNN
jgi:tetratricopeptide (TPR) repeat protein